MHKKRVCVKEHNLSRRVFAIFLSCVRAVLFMSCVFWPFVFLFDGDGGADLGERGRDIGRGIAEGGAGVTDGDANELDSSPIFSEGGE